MKHRYLPMTEARSNKKCLKQLVYHLLMNCSVIFLNKFDLKENTTLKKAKSESALLKELSQLAAKNADLRHNTSFLRCRCI